MATELTVTYEFVSKYPRNTEADGIRWAHLLIDGAVDTDYLNFVCGYGFSTTWQSAMLNELIRLARQGHGLTQQ